MVSKIIGFIGKEIKGLHEAAYLLAIFSFFSLLLGLIRDRLLASEFGASAILDVYYTSFRLPDLLFVIVTSLVSAAVLVPVFSKHLENREELKKYVDSLFTVFISLMVIICVVTYIFTPQILVLTAPGLIYGEYSDLLITFTRLLLLSPILLGISQLFGGIVQAYRKFVIYAISPILYNLGIILGIIFFYPIFGNLGLIYGVILGLILHVIVQIPTITSCSLLPKISLRFDRLIVKEVFKLSLPRTIALATSQIILVVLIALASKMAEGSVAVFSFAYNLQAVPLTIIGVSYSLAAFPTLSKLYHQGKINEYLSNISAALKHIVFWSLPVVILFIVLRAQIVRVVLGSGAFDWNDTRLTAAALAIFIISTLAQSSILLFVRSFYAAGETIKPLVINVASSIFTIFISISILPVYVNNEGFRVFVERLLRVEGGLESEILVLPIAFSIGIIINSIFIWIAFERQYGGFTKNLVKPALESLFASILMGITAYISLQYFAEVFDLDTLIGIFSQGLFAGILGILVMIITLYVIGNREIRDVWKTLHHRIWGAKVISTGVEEL